MITGSTTEVLEDDGANTAEVDVDGAGLGLGLGLLSWIFILGKNQRGETYLVDAPSIAAGELLGSETLAREAGLDVCDCMIVSIVPHDLAQRCFGPRPWTDRGHTIDGVALDTHVLDLAAGDLLGDGVAAHEGLGVAAGWGGALDNGCGGGESEGEEGEEVGELHFGGEVGGEVWVWGLAC